MSEPGPINLEALPLAARTAQVTTADLLSMGDRAGMALYLNTTVASGTGGLTLQILVNDPISGLDIVVWAAAAAVIATGVTRHLIYPAAQAGTGSQWTSLSGMALPRRFRIRVAVGDASSYTYQVSYELLS